MMSQEAQRRLNIPVQSRQHLKAILTLYGNKDSGKTATLRYLCYLLNSNKALAALSSGFKDFRISFDYTGPTGNSARILVSTVGDSVPDIQDNWDWFLGVRALPTGGNHRPCIGGIGSTEKEIVVSPTRLSDQGTALNDWYISHLKPSVSFVHYIHKDTNGGGKNNGIVSPADWDILLGPEQYGKGKWTEEMASGAISAAQAIKEQIDTIIKCI